MSKIGNCFKNINVLIADPDERIRTIIKDALANTGFEKIYPVSNGEAAIKQLRKHNIDILITDWRMKPVDGIKLIDYIRNDSKSLNPYLPIIMLTGKAEFVDISTARDAGVTEFLVKPFTAKALYERIAIAIESPRNFISADDFHGPNRRRRTDAPPSKDRRTSAPVKGKI